MDAKHTPGPWAVDAEDMAQDADGIFTISIWADGPEGDRPLVASSMAFALLSETQGGCEYVTTTTAQADKLAEAKANARLIAAAPDLLAALQELTHSLDKDDLMHDDQRAAFRASLAAIAKATGAAL